MRTAANPAGPPLGIVEAEVFPTMTSRVVFGLCALLLWHVDAQAQFRRGILAESTEITVYPHQAPAILLPAGPVELEVKNATGAPARIVGYLRDLLERQLLENDARIDVVPRGGSVVVTATMIEWNETRRSSTKYVSEKRQVGTKQVRDKNGNYKSEPIYEYGRNKPSVVIKGAAGMRIEVRRRAGATPIADETVRYTIDEEHLVDEGPPSREAVEDQLLDHVVRQGAGRVTAARNPRRVLLARSDEVDALNGMAQQRRWNDWLTDLERVRPHRDPKRDAYRLHNLAVAHEALAYESDSPEDWKSRLALASSFIGKAATQNPGEKYIIESADRISVSSHAYERLAGLYAEAGTAPPVSRPPSERPATAPPPPAAAPAPPPANAAPMSNQDVVDLRAAGLDDDNLLAAIKEAKAVAFDLSPAGLKSLLGAKVSNRVITAMRARTK